LNVGTPPKTDKAKSGRAGRAEDKNAQDSHRQLLATPEERSHYEICRSSVYWPKLDCDISSDCLLRGAKEARRFAEKAWRRLRLPA
jgi:hypothetical protein